MSDETRADPQEQEGAGRQFGVPCPAACDDGSVTVAVAVAACCGQTRPDGDCCGNPIPEPSRERCEVCGGAGQVEVVPASDLEAAVKALEEIVAELDERARTWDAKVPQTRWREGMATGLHQAANIVSRTLTRLQPDSGETS